FQAEDGIRDFHVTGVQTCALPIMHPTSRKSLSPVAVALFACLAAVACAPASSDTPAPSDAPAPQDAFVANLRALCGQAFAGTVETDVPAAPGNDALAGPPRVHHVRQCDQEGPRIPFHGRGHRPRT